MESDLPLGQTLLYQLYCALDGKACYVGLLRYGLTDSWTFALPNRELGGFWGIPGDRFFWATCRGKHEFHEKEISEVEGCSSVVAFPAIAGHG